MSQKPVAADTVQSGDTDRKQIEESAATVSPTSAAPAASAAPVQLDAARVLQFYASVVSHERFAVAATAFATEIAATLLFDRVSVGFMDGSGYAKVVAISHSADLESQTNIVRTIGEAMDEALEQSSTIVFPPPAGDRPQITLAHALLAKQHGGSVCTIPLVANGRAFGAVTLQRASATPLRRHEIADCEHLACLVGPVLDLKRSNERPWYSRVAQRTRSGWQSLRAPGHIRLKATVAVVTLALAVLLFLPVTYHVSAPARLEGSIQRVLVAPVDGFLRQAHVRPGDNVKAGQVLVELAEQDLQLERRKRESELAQHENAYTAALARADRTQYAINQAKAAEAAAQLDLVEQQISRSRVQAPFDGIVIKGDLTQSLGAPVQRGETLLTIAPANQFRLIVDVDERDIAHVAPGQPGQLALGALPGNTLGFRVERVTPVATARDGRNFFEVVGELDAAAVQALRPGLQGVAKIQAENRTLAWIWTHRFVDWLRITLWSWGA